MGPGLTRKKFENHHKIATGIDILWQDTIHVYFVWVYCMLLKVVSHYKLSGQSMSVKHFWIVVISIHYFCNFFLLCQPSS